MRHSLYLNSNSNVIIIRDIIQLRFVPFEPDLLYVTNRRSTRAKLSHVCVVVNARAIKPVSTTRGCRSVFAESFPRHNFELFGTRMCRFALVAADIRATNRPTNSVGYAPLATEFSLTESETTSKSLIAQRACRMILDERSTRARLSTVCRDLECETRAYRNCTF